MPRTLPEKEVRKLTAIRLSDVEHKLIRERADARKLTLSEYLRRCALGELADPSSTDERFEEIERRLDALERAADLGGFG